MEGFTKVGYLQKEMPSKDIWSRGRKKQYHAYKKLKSVRSDDTKNVYSFKIFLDNFTSPIAVHKILRSWTPSSALQQPFRIGDECNYMSKASPDQEVTFPSFRILQGSLRWQQ